MLQLVTWALLTGGVTGAVWVAIVLLQRRHRERAAELDVLADAQAQLDALPDSSDRLLELEERLDFAERTLLQQRRAAAEPPRPFKTP
jgi:hypothetical protein